MYLTYIDHIADRTLELISQPIDGFKNLLNQPVDNPASRIAYGTALFNALFASPEAERFFGESLQNAVDTGQPLRVQMEISRQSPPWLHNLWWETLHDPSGSGLPLALFEGIYFSRYVASSDSRRVAVRNPANLKALVVIAKPRNCSHINLPDFDVEAQCRLARGALQMEVSYLCSTGNQAVTLDDICIRLRDGPGDNGHDDRGFDILYLVCHGFFTTKESEPRLWLQNEDGIAVAVSGVGLAARLAELKTPPLLVVLVSCQSAGIGGNRPGDTGALTAMGPRLAFGGVPAVLAMRGNITVDTMNIFLPAFFNSLQQDGQIDKAVALGRNAIRDRPDAWMPILFMRLNRGRLWAEPIIQEFGDNTWNALITNLTGRQCTPILGAGLLDHLVGSQKEIARSLANRFHFPLAPDQQEDLPQVTQFLSLTQGSMTARNVYINRLKLEVLRKFGDRLKQDERQLEFPELLATASRLAQQEDGPFRLLAKLKCPLYVTTTPDCLLSDALNENGAERVESYCCSWQGRQVFGSTPPLTDGRSTLVYHLFGQYSFDQRRQRWDYSSLVLSQDDYFEYLIRYGVDCAPPAEVREALAASSLLFLGFELNDWTFRIVLQSIETLGSKGAMLDDYLHVAIQLEPDPDPTQDVEAVRHYLQQLARLPHANVQIFWGKPQRFLEQLVGRLPPGY